MTVSLEELAEAVAELVVGPRPGHLSAPWVRDRHRQALAQAIGCDERDVRLWPTLSETEDGGWKPHLAAAYRLPVSCDRVLIEITKGDKAT